MRIVFMGTPEFAVPSLAALLRHGAEVAGVVTVPDKPAGRGLRSTASPIKQFAETHGLPVLTPDSLRDPRFLEELKALRPECAVVVAFRILPPDVYLCPPFGTFNLHASLLPKYRGAAPINWAVINGESETGVTTFFLREKVDTGDVILQKKTPIGPDDSAGDVHDRLAVIGAEAVVETVRLIATGRAATLPQDDSLASPAPKIFTDDCRIDWSRSAPDVHNFIRGLSPRPGAFTRLGGRVLKIFRSVVVPGESAPNPGEVICSEGRLKIGTGGGVVEVLDLQMEGKKRLSAAEFLRGANLNSGAVLGS
jgi:methionyl-tRNA formyltransferase